MKGREGVGGRERRREGRELVSEREGGSGRKGEREEEGREGVSE